MAIACFSAYRQVGSKPQTHCWQWGHWALGSTVVLLSLLVTSASLAEPLGALEGDKALVSEKKPAQTAEANTTQWLNTTLSRVQPSTPLQPPLEPKLLLQAEAEPSFSELRPMLQAQSQPEAQRHETDLEADREPLNTKAFESTETKASLSTLPKLTPKAPAQLAQAPLSQPSIVMMDSLNTPDTGKLLIDLNQFSEARAEQAEGFFEVEPTYTQAELEAHSGSPHSGPPNAEPYTHEPYANGFTPNSLQPSGFPLPPLQPYQTASLNNPQLNRSPSFSLHTTQGISALAMDAKALTATETEATLQPVSLASYSTDPLYWVSPTEQLLFLGQLQLASTSSSQATGWSLEDFQAFDLSTPSALSTLGLGFLALSLGGFIAFQRFQGRLRPVKKPQAFWASLNATPPSTLSVATAPLSAPFLTSPFGTGALHPAPVMAPILKRAPQRSSRLHCPNSQAYLIR